MRQNATNRNVLTAVTLILMFLFADVFVPSAFPAPDLLDDEPTIQHSITIIGPQVDTYIDSANPTLAYPTAASALLGVSGSSDARILISFPNNYATTDTIH